MVALIGSAVIVAVLLVSLATWLRSSRVPPRVTEITQLTNDGELKYPPLFADGPRLYFRKGPFGRSPFLYQVSSTGGDTSQVLSQMNFMMDISKDRSEFLGAEPTAAMTDFPIWIVPLPTGAPRRLGSITGQDATWSPDGQKIAYAKGQELYVTSRDGSDSHKIITVEGRPVWIRWSPIKNVLRFTQTGATGGSLWEFPLTGVIFIPCFRIGVVSLRNVAGIGLPMANITSSTRTVRDDTIFGRLAKVEDFSARAVVNQCDSLQALWNSPVRYLSETVQEYLSTPSLRVAKCKGTMPDRSSTFRICRALLPKG